MCGIAGYSCFKDYDNRIDIAMPILAIYMENRGRKSWGWTNGSDQVIKELGEISDGFNPSFYGYKQAALHTRQPTTGSVIAANSHPFKIGDVIGMHNGVVRNHDALQKKYERTCNVDSEHIFHHINENKPLSEISAYGAVVYWKEGVLHLGRFNGGELSLAKSKTCYIFSSTKETLDVALLMSGMEKEAFPRFLREGILYRIEGEDLIEAGKLDFDEYDTKKYGGWENYEYASSSYAPTSADQSYWNQGHWQDVLEEGKPVKRVFIRDAIVLAKPKAQQNLSSTVGNKFITTDERILEMIKTAVGETHEHKSEAWPCSLCGVSLYDGNTFYILKNTEFGCEACASQFPDEVISEPLTQFPEDIALVGSFFDSKADATLECDRCDDTMLADDYFVYTQDKEYLCVPCFGAGEEDSTEIEKQPKEELGDGNDEMDETLAAETEYEASSAERINALIEEDNMVERFRNAVEEEEPRAYDTNGGIVRGMRHLN